MPTFKQQKELTIMGTAYTLYETDNISVEIYEMSNKL